MNNFQYDTQGKEPSGGGKKRRLSEITESEMIGLIMCTVPDYLKEKPTEDDYAIEMFYNDDAVQVDGDVIVGAEYSVVCYDGQITITDVGDINLYDEDGDHARVFNQLKCFQYLRGCGFNI